MRKNIWIQSIFGLCCVFYFIISSLSCSSNEPTGPLKCHYDHECKGKDERCMFSDPTCAAKLGSCEGLCKVPSITPPRKCQCKKDEDCNYPFEGCTNCICYKREVLSCKVDKDCGRGRHCAGSGDKKVCEISQHCEKDNDCLYGSVCREKSCCNPAITRCSGICKAGTECSGDLDCFTCGMICKKGVCSLQGTPGCSGEACKTDTDCASCKGTCQGGYCRVPIQCKTFTCIEDSDCRTQNYNTCISGCCH